MDKKYYIIGAIVAILGVITFVVLRQMKGKKIQELHDKLMSNFDSMHSDYDKIGTMSAEELEAFEGKWYAKWALSLKEKEDKYDGWDDMVAHQTRFVINQKYGKGSFERFYTLDVEPTV